MSDRSFIGGGVAAALVAVCAVAMLVLTLLYAFAPDLRGDDTADANALSKSAIGFAGLRALMTGAGIPVEIGRDPNQRGRPSLVIVTPPLTMSAAQLLAWRASAPTLMILPKWETAALPDNRAWVMKIDAIPTKILQDQITAVLGPATVLRTSGKSRNIALKPGVASPPGMAISRLGAIVDLQTLLGGKPVLNSLQGIVLTRAPRKGPLIFVLSDPDILNNLGLADETNASAALALIAALRQGDGAVRMDVTLDGLARTETMLRSLFLPPFLGATLCALIAALLMGLHSWVRFGAPLEAERVFARGKKALADNSADLVRVMGREGAMAPRYVASARALVLDAIAARPASVQAQDALLAVLERGGDNSYAGLEREAAEAKGGGDLLRIARKTYAWRERITRGYR